MNPIDEFKTRVERFLEATGMPPATLGRKALGDSRFVDDLRTRKRRCFPETIEKVDAFMASYRIPGASSAGPERHERAAVRS